MTRTRSIDRPAKGFRPIASCALPAHRSLFGLLAVVVAVSASTVLQGAQGKLDLIAQAGGRLQTITLARPEPDRAATLSLFERLVPDMPAIPEKQLAIAAYEHAGQWRVLTPKRLSVETYTAALNTALQALFGLKGESPMPSKRA